MAQDWVKDYPESKQIDKESLGNNHSLVKMLNFIVEDTTGKRSGGEKVRIVDFGCATGYFPALLRQSGYIVTGVEINPDAARVAEEFCERVIVADLDITNVQELFPSEKFDIATFGDVLEHLRDPWKILRDVRHILKPDGLVVASIPNIAHGDIRLALLQGDFDYSPLGILDNTHLRFFTKKTVDSLFESSGYLIQAEDATHLPLFSGSNLVPKLDASLTTSSLANQIRQDQNSDILQFIVKAVPATLEARHQALNIRYSQLSDANKQLKKDYHSLAEEHQQLVEQLEGLKEEFRTQLSAIQLRLEQESIRHQQAQKTAAGSLEEQQQALQAEKLHSMRIEQSLVIEKHKHEALETAIAEEIISKQDLQVKFDEVKQSLLQTQHQLALAELDINGMKSSKFWRLRSQWFGIRKVLGIVNEDISVKQAVLQKLRLVPPPQTLPAVPTDAALLLAIASPEIPTTSDPLYQQWLNHNYPTSAILKRLASSLPALKYQPLISIIVPVYNPPIAYLRKAIDSVLEQIYPNWELCIADDASPNPEVRAILEQYSAQDKRVKTVFRDQNGHISLSSNSALTLATGEFIALLDHDDILTPDALYEVILLLNQHPKANMLYSDEDKIDDSGQLHDPFFKPDWCPDSFLSRMYTCHFGVYRRKIIEQIGGFRAGYEGSQDYDLVLRFTEKTEEIFHIPKILYHWRIHPESAASCPDQKPYAAIASEKALLEALERRGEPGKVFPVKNLTGHYTVRYDIKEKKKVSIIIPTKDLAQTLETCLKSIFERTLYPDYEVIVIDNGSIEKKTAQLLRRWEEKEPKRFSCYPLDIPFNYSKINNFAVTKAQGDYLLFLNNDTEVITTDWIEAMVEQCQRPSIGVVGAFLFYPDNTVQHAGVVLGVGGVAGHSHKHFSKDSYGYFDQLKTINNYSASTGACLMCRKEIFEQVGGFEEKLSVAFNDVDFCLKIIELGHRNITLPHVNLYHYESKSRGYEDTPEKKQRFTEEINYMQAKWKKYIEFDPCYNPNLTRTHENHSIGLT